MQKIRWPLALRVLVARDKGLLAAVFLRAVTIAKESLANGGCRHVETSRSFCMALVSLGCRQTHSRWR